MRLAEPYHEFYWRELDALQAARRVAPAPTPEPPRAPTAWDLGKQFTTMVRDATRPRRVLRRRGTKKGR